MSQGRWGVGVVERLGPGDLDICNSNQTPISQIFLNQRIDFKKYDTGASVGMFAKFLPNVCQDVTTYLVCLLRRPGSGPTRKCLILLSKRLRDLKFSGFVSNKCARRSSLCRGGSYGFQDQEAGAMNDFPGTRVSTLS